jgi:subtilisin-like proprotein convertase family protein
MRLRLGILSLLLWLACAPAWAARTACNDNGGAGWPINDGSATTIDIDYGFADVGFITDLDVDVDISHTYTGDLSASITSPNGTTVSLFERPNTTAVTGAPYGCPGDDIDVLFDDESGNAPLENFACANSPAFSGTHRPHNNAPNNLSAIDDETPSGVWSFYFQDPIGQDTGRMNEACIVVSSAAATFDQWVSSNATCSDQIDTLTVLTGDTLYMCYTLTNDGDEAFTLNSGDWTDSLGQNLAGLEGSYAGGASTTLNFGPFTAGSSPFPIGATVGVAEVTVTGNSATFPSSRTLVTDETVRVAVSNTPPAAGNKQLYLYNNLSMSRSAPLFDQAELTFNEGVSRTWTLTPSLQSSFVLDPAATAIPVTVYLRETGNGTSRNLILTLEGSASGEIGTLSTAVVLNGTSTAYTFNVPISGVRSLVGGEAITLFLQNTTTGGGQRAVIVDPADAGTNLSLVNLPAETVINVDSVQAYAVDYATAPGAAPISTIFPGETVYIRSSVSDPFGSFDITSATIDVSDPTPTLLVNDAALTEVQDSGASTKIYEYTYNISPFAVQGIWRFETTANEGTEGVNHNNYLDLSIVAPPVLTVVKTTGAATANPGDSVAQFVMVTNSGAGPADSVHLSNTVNPFTTLDTGSFSCSAGCPGSGVTFAPPTFTMDGSGKVTLWEIDMGGSLDPSGGSFTIQYQVTVN